MTLRMDGVELDQINTSQPEAPARDPEEFWASTPRLATSSAKEVLEISLGSLRSVNTVSFDVSRFPLLLWIEWWDETVQEWGMLRHTMSSTKLGGVGMIDRWTAEEKQQPVLHTPLKVRIAESVPLVVNKSSFDEHPQHYGTNHWRSETWKSDPVRTRKIRFVLQRDPAGVPPVNPLGKRVEYSLALRKIKVGYRIEGPTDLTAENEGQPFESSTDILGSTVLHSVYAQGAERAVDGTNRTSWRSDPQPINYAVVPFYVDLRTPDGQGQVVDCWYVDPLTTGVHCNLYYSDEEPTGDYRGGRAPVPASMQSPEGTPDLTGDQIRLGPDLLAGVGVAPNFTRLDTAQPWWVGLDAVALTGADDEAHRPLLSMGDLLLVQTGGLLRLLHRTGRSVEVQLPVEHVAGTTYRVIVSYDAQAVDPAVTLSYVGSGYFHQEAHTPIELTGLADVRVGLVGDGVEFSGYADLPSNLGVKGLVVKTTLLTPEVKSWFLDEGEGYVRDDLTFVSQTRGASTNAILRMHPAFATEVNPFGVVGGDSSRIESNLWTPVPRDFVLRRGWMNHAPVRAKYAKFEFTQLSPRLYETFLTMDRTVRCFPAEVVEEYARTGPQTVNNTVPHGTATMVDGTFDGHTYIDALNTLRNAPPGYGPEVTSVLVATSPNGADAASDSGWVWQYQPWHAGSISPRWNKTTRHYYESIPVRHRAKVAYYAGLKDLRPGRHNVGAGDDTPEYTERFWFDGGFEEFTGFDLLDGGGAVANSTSARITSGMLSSRTPVQRIQFATMQTNPVQVIPDPDFVDPALAEYLGYGDATPEWIESGSVRVKRFYTPTTNLVMENLTYEEMDRYTYEELEGSSFTASPVFGGPQPGLVGEIGPASAVEASPTAIRPHQISSTPDVPIEPIPGSSGDIIHGQDPNSSVADVVPGSVHWFRLTSPESGKVTLDSYLSELTGGGWVDLSGGTTDIARYYSSLQVEFWVEEETAITLDRYRYGGRARVEVEVTAGVPLDFAVYVNSLDPDRSTTMTLRVRTSDVNSQQIWNPYDRPAPAYSEGGVVTAGSYLPMGAGEVTAKVRLSADSPLAQPVLVEIIGGEDGSGEVLASASKQIYASGTTEISTSYTPPGFDDVNTQTYGEIEDLFVSDPSEPPEPDYSIYDVGPGSPTPGTTVIDPTILDPAANEVGRGGDASPGSVEPAKIIAAHQISTNEDLPIRGSGTTNGRMYRIMPTTTGSIIIDLWTSTDPNNTAWNPTGRIAYAEWDASTMGDVDADVASQGRHRYTVFATVGEPIGFTVYYNGPPGTHADIRVLIGDYNTSTLWDPWAPYSVEDGHSRTLIGPHQVSITPHYNWDATHYRYYQIVPTITGMLGLDLLLTEPEEALPAPAPPLTLRTNLVTNPSLEVNTTGWSHVYSPTSSQLTRSTAQAQVGLACGALTSASDFGGPGAMGVRTTVPVVAGTIYTASQYIRAATVGRSATLSILWKNSGGGTISTTSGTPVSDTTTGWTRISATGTAPGGAVTAEVQLIWAAVTTNNEAHYFDSALVEAASSVAAYFDGATPDAGGIDYSWTGAPHNSSSVTATVISVARTNLMPNPSFETNATGWTTTAGASTISREAAPFGAVGDWVLKVGSTAPTPVVGAAYWSLGGTPGNQYAFSLATKAMTAPLRHVRLTIIWFNVSLGDEISRTEVDAGPITTQFARYGMVATAPANVGPGGAGANVGATYQVSFDGATPGEEFLIDAVLVEKTDALSPGPYFDGASTDTSMTSYTWTGTAHGSTSFASITRTVARTNLCPNPSFETNTNGWSLIYSAISSRLERTPTVQALKGGCVGSNTASTDFGGGSMGVKTSIPVVAGTTYTASLSVRAVTYSRTARLTVDWKNSGGTTISTSAATPTSDIIPNWVRLFVTAAAPAGAVTAELRLIWEAVTPSEVHYFDAVLFEAGTIGQYIEHYFDGATTDTPTLDYAWASTPHNSVSYAANIDPEDPEPEGFSAYILNVSGAETVSEAIEDGRHRNLYSLTAGVPFRFNVYSRVVVGGVEDGIDTTLFLRVSATDDTTPWVPIPDTRAEYEVGPGSLNPASPTQIYPRSLSTSNYSYAEDTYLNYAFLPAESGEISIDTYLTTPGSTPADWLADLEPVEGVEDLTFYTLDQRVRFTGTVLAGEWVRFRARAYRIIDGALSPVPTMMTVRVSAIGDIALWVPEPYAPPTSTTYGFLEQYTYGQLESTTFDAREKVSVRVRQQGITDDEFVLHQVALYDDPVAWSYSVDDGASWWRAPSVRNRPFGVVTLPAPGNMMRWRVEVYREGVWLSDLRIRPWYGLAHHPADPADDLEQAGPNDSAADNYPRLSRHPLWVLPERPVHLSPVRLDGVPTEQFWRNLVTNPGAEGPDVLPFLEPLVDEAQINGQTEAGGTSA